MKLLQERDPQGLRKASQLRIRTLFACGVCSIQTINSGASCTSLKEKTEDLMGKRISSNHWTPLTRSELSSGDIVDRLPHTGAATDCNRQKIPTAT
ncbi:hypothetical protein LEMLEM_LOCUS7564, partial [Lemmus lemmus]